MAANRNTTWAFRLGLIAIAFMACRPALAVSFIGCGGNNSEASCASGGTGNCNASQDAGCNQGCQQGCNQACQQCGNSAGSDCNNSADCKSGGCFGFLPENFCHDRNCCCGTKSSCDECCSRFITCMPFFKDLCETCESCTWKVDASALILHRSQASDRAVLQDPITGGTLFNTSSFDYGYAAGPRLSFIVQDCQGWAFELNYFGIDGWSSVHDVPNTSMPNGLGTLTVDSVIIMPLTDAHFQATSRLYSSEFNFRRPWFGDMSFLAGFRWVEMTDRYLAEGTSASTATLVSQAVKTHNHLYGFQIGADGTLFQTSGCFRMNAFVKTGVFLNVADQASSLSDPGGAGNFAVNNTQDQATFLGEAGLVGYFQLSKHFALSGGYQVMSVFGVAQPVNQILSTDLIGSTANVDTTSSIFYHGATAGVELTW